MLELLPLLLVHHTPCIGGFPPCELKDLFALREHVVERLAPVLLASSFSNLGSNLLHVLLPGLVDFLLEVLLQGALGERGLM